MTYLGAKHTVVYEKDGVGRKLCKIMFGADGSYYVTSPYHPAKGALLYKLTVNYDLQEVKVPLEQAIDIASVDDDEGRIKLSHHPDGFLQFSGPGVVSGKDEEGNIRGMGVESWSLDGPAEGPAFILSMTGVEGFDRADRVRDKACLFRHEDLTPMPGKTLLVLEGHYLPELWRRFVRIDRNGDKVISVSHPAGAVLELKAILPPERCPLQHFFGLEVYTMPVPEGDEELEAGFLFCGSTGRLRENEEGQTVGDGIYCRYPADADGLARRSLDYLPDR